eukprot:1319650-Amorphochlora_amoeboformis.AAC.1
MRSLALSARCGQLLSRARAPYLASRRWISKKEEGEVTRMSEEDDNFGLVEKRVFATYNESKYFPDSQLNKV